MIPAPFRWIGWFDGTEDCEPPEPGKYWLEVQDADFNEVCIIVYRTESFNQIDEEVLLREQIAKTIVAALNLCSEDMELKES